MSTGYGWEGIRQVCHVRCCLVLAPCSLSERLWGGSASTWAVLGRYTSVRRLPLPLPVHSAPAPATPPLPWLRSVRILNTTVVFHKVVYSDMSEVWWDRRFIENVLMSLLEKEVLISVNGPIKTAHFFEIPYFCCHYRYNHAVFAEVFRNYSRKQQATIFLNEC